jgi:phosphate transport system permease protein
MGIDTQSSVQLTPLERALGRSKASLTQETLFKHVRIGERIIFALLLFSGIASIFTTLGIVWVLGSQSRLFLSAEAWLPVKVPLINEDAPAFELGSSLSSEDTFIAVNLTSAAEVQAYLPGNYLQVEDEIMLVSGRTESGIIVDRAQNGTLVTTHVAGTEVLPMREEQVRTLSGMPSTPDEAVEADTFEEALYWDRIYLEEWALEQFSPGQIIKLGTSGEDMRVESVDIEAGYMTVEREVGELGAVSHPINEQVNLPDPVRLGEFFTNTRWQPTIGEFGIAPLVSATLLTSFVAMLVAIPFGLGSAIYLSEYARPELRSTLKPVLEILAGVPTVVYGYFAIQAMTPFLQLITPEGLVGVYNMASAGLVMGIMILPTVSSMSEDALSAVPRALREASYGLGGTRLETTTKVVIPAALSGILAAFIVAISRAVGETMIVAVAAGGRPNFTLNPFAEAETMTGHIVRISKGDLTYNSVEYNSIFAIGITLFVITLTLNLISGWIVRRFREAY